MEQVKYLTLDDLIELKFVKVKNKQAWEPHLAYPIVSHMLHDDREVRCSIAINSAGDTVMLEVPLAKFNCLRAIPVHESVANNPKGLSPFDMRVAHIPREE